MTARYQFEALGITLWSPDDGLTVLLLMEGVKFLPVVLAGAVLADVLISHVHHSFYVTVLTETASTLGYMGLAVALHAVLKFRLERRDLANVLVMLAAVPAGSILNSLIYCGVLYLAGSMPADGSFPRCAISGSATQSESLRSSRPRRRYPRSHQKPVGSGGELIRSTGRCSLSVRAWRSRSSTARRALTPTICSICFSCRSSG
jgi:hypothetical protein